MRTDKSRDLTAGPSTGPQPPFPISLSGPVIQGFGRGSKELGIPTANIPPEGLPAYPELESGVYYGVVALDPSGSPKSKTVKDDTTAAILPAVLSIGYNPFYKNSVRSVEIHIMRSLSSVEQAEFNKMPDFYSTRLNLVILGYIRPEYDYVSREALIEDIRTDCEVARRSLSREAYICYLEEEDGETDAAKKSRAWLTRF